MSRMHPGVPPSRRRNWPGDWRERLRTTTRSLATKMRDTFEFDDPTTRRLLIAAVRLALGEATQADLDRKAGDDSNDAEEAAIATTAQAYRIILDGDGIDRKNPVTAESFMAEVVEALDEEMGLGWRTKVRKVTKMLVAGLRKSRSDDVAEIRKAIIEAAREALSDRPLADMVKIVEFPESEACPDGVEPFISNAGVFRMVVDNEALKPDDPATARTFMAEVVAVLDAELPASGGS